jgi:hypothetical protein
MEAEDALKRFPEIQELWVGATEFLLELNDDDYLAAMIDDWALDADPDYWVDDEGQ